MSDLVKRADEALKDVTPYDGDLGLCEHCADNQATLFSGREAICTSCHDARLAELVPAMRDRIEADAKRIKKLKTALALIGEMIDARSELFTSDADLLLNIQDRICAELGEKKE